MRNGRQLTMMTTIHDDLCIEYSLLKSQNTFQIIFGNGISFCVLLVFSILRKCTLFPWLFPPAQVPSAIPFGATAQCHEWQYVVYIVQMYIYTLCRYAARLFHRFAQSSRSIFPFFLSISLRRSTMLGDVWFVKQFHVLSLIFHLTLDHLKFRAEAKMGFFLHSPRSLSISLFFSIYVLSIVCVCVCECVAIVILVLVHRLPMPSLLLLLLLCRKSLLFQAYHTSHYIVFFFFHLMLALAVGRVRRMYTWDITNA